MLFATFLNNSLTPVQFGDLIPFKAIYYRSEAGSELGCETGLGAAGCAGSGCCAGVEGT